MLATITTDLDKIAPRFEMQPEQITIIRTPAEFYETLKVGCDFTLVSLSSLVDIECLLYLVSFLRFRVCSLVWIIYTAELAPC